MTVQTFIDIFNVAFNTFFKRCLVFLYLFPNDFLKQLDHFKKYFNCNLIKFKFHINYLSCISSSLTSHSSNIQSLTELITQLPGLIKDVLCNLKSGIGLNINLLCIHITNIGCTIQCFNREIHEAVKNINSIIKLICKCNNGIKCLQKCLKEIRCKLQKLYLELHEINVKIWRINSLRVETQEILKCNKDTHTLKFRINELVERYKCSIKEFKCIESQIKSVKSKIAEISKLKQDLFKYIETNGNTMKLTIKCDRTLIAYIAKVNDSNGNNRHIKSLIEKIKCLTGKIDEICSGFEKIEDNSAHLKHSLLFNSYYLQISSYILEKLQCIETQQTKLNEKLSTLKQVPSQISMITNNIMDVKSVIEKINQRRVDLGYVRKSLCSILPKLCKIKDSAEQITKKMTELQSVIEALKKIKTSIENLKDLECEQKCLEIFEVTDKTIFSYSLICIKDNLNIKNITDKLDIINKSIYIIEVMLLIKNSIETLSFI